MLRAHRLHGRRRGRSADPVHRKEAAVAGRQKTDEVFEADDQVGQSPSVGVGGRHQMFAARDARLGLGGDGHIPRAHVRHPVEFDLSDQSVAVEMG